MKETRILMGMPITLEVAEQSVTQEDLGQVFAYFASVDERFSTYKDTSEISQINRGELSPDQYSKDMQTILALSEQTRQETNGYFDIRRNGMIDPSGLVKGWAIQHAAQLLKARGFRNFYIDAGGDIQIVGTKAGEPWKEIVYGDVLNAAQTTLGVKTLYSLTDATAVPRTWPGLVGRPNAQMIQRTVPDYQERMYYVSGPPEMVRACEDVLKSLHIRHDRIKKDFFPGLA